MYFLSLPEKTSMDTSGQRLFLPVGLLDYFDIIRVHDDSSGITIYLEEKNNINDANAPSRYESKGFYPSVTVNDFPVRGKALYLNLRRRRWINKETGEYINRDFGMVADGTRLTQEFASFLKGTHR